MLLDPRPTYAPFEYQKAYDYWERQQQAHWLHHEISMAGDIHDWRHNLSETEKNLIGHILKGFTQSEVFIQEYWSSQVSNWFKKPEIQLMCAAFASMESVHAVSYAYLNQSLGLEDFAAFLSEPTAKAKIDRLIATRGRDPQSIARSLAVFSAFNEGVNLFSSFAILLNFSRFNKMKGLGQIIAFSIKDESLHSEAGCWLYRTLLSEYPDIRTKAHNEAIEEAAFLTADLEFDFLDKAFDLGQVEGIERGAMRNFIRHRIDTKLRDLGHDQVFHSNQQYPVAEMQWFDVLSAGVSHTDFFAQRVTDYSKGVVDFSGIFD